MGERQNCWKRKNRPAMNLYRRKWMKNNPKKRQEDERRYVKKHRAEINARRRKWKSETGYDRRRNRKIRERVIKKYGGKCACCGIRVFEFLSFDHKKGRGKQHREGILRTGQKFVIWLDKRPRQKNIQLLCHNCNQALGHYGYCPHSPKNTRPILHGTKRV